MIRSTSGVLKPSARPRRAVADDRRAGDRADLELRLRSHCLQPQRFSDHRQPVFYDAQNTPPGSQACSALAVGANVSKPFSVASQCALPAGSNFDLLVLAEATGAQPLYGHARTQDRRAPASPPKASPIENFNDQIQHSTGLKRVATCGGLPACQTNCFVATLGDAVNYELRLFDGDTNTQLGSTLSGSLQKY